MQKGALLVKLARKSIEGNFGKVIGLTADSSEFKDRYGVFVSFHTWPENELRGCIGFPYPIMQLGKAVIEAARAAAFEDPRFLPLAEKEMNNIIIEISVLSKPELIDASKDDLPDEIRIGRDGLLCTLGLNTGLLLPQVAVEQKWNSLQFLEQVCLKAGLGANRWMHPQCKIYKFQAQIFSETKPNGKVAEKKLKK
jgi:hypothetical protein